jgi:hypothetical protein
MPGTDLDRPFGPEGAPPLQSPCRMGTLSSNWHPLFVEGYMLFATPHPVGGLRVRSILRREAPIQRTEPARARREAPIPETEKTEATFR